jgi:hypothetical protein
MMSLLLLLALVFPYKLDCAVFCLCFYLFKGGRSVGIVRSRTKGHGVCFIYLDPGQPRTLLQLKLFVILTINLFLT